MPKFWEAIRSGKGEFVNGSRLVYPMEDEAMRFLNLIANKMFSYIFSWLLNQRYTDTLCGTKVIRRSDYERLKKGRAYFGDFDPFGDFDLIFGASKAQSEDRGNPDPLSEPQLRRDADLALPPRFHPDQDGHLRLLQGQGAMTDALNSYRDVWNTKPVLRAIYGDLFDRIVSRCTLGPTLEIGGGIGNLKDRLEDVWSSDIQYGPWLDLVADAQRLPFPNESLGSVVMLDVLHHVEWPLLFLRETARVLRPGGRIVMIEPAITWGSTLFYRFIHHEPVVMSVDPLLEGAPRADRDPYDSNQAIPTLIATRDRERLHRLISRAENHGSVLVLVYGLSDERRLQALVADPAIARGAAAARRAVPRIRVGPPPRLPHDDRNGKAMNIGAMRQLIKRVGPAALIAPFLASSAVWIVRDQSVWPWDQAWYGEVTLDLWQARRFGLVSWVNAMVHAFELKPPALALIGQFLVPLGGITGNIESSLLLVNILAAAATLATLYLLARHLGATRTESLAGVLLCAGAQIFVGLTDQYLVEIIQCFTAAAMIAIAWRIERRSRVRAIALTVLVAALSFLTKGSAATYVLPLIVYMIIAIFFSARRDRPAPRIGDIILDVVLSLVALVTLIGTVSWYVINWRFMVQHVIDASSGSASLNFGSAANLLVKLKFWIVALAAEMSPFAVMAIAVFGLIAVGLLVALARLVRHPFVNWIATAIEDGTLLALVLAGTIAANIAAYSLQVSEVSRYLMPLLPMIAVLLAWSLSLIRNKYLSSLVVVGLLVNAVVVHGFTHGKVPLFGLRSPWLATVKRSAVDKHILTEAVDATCQKEIANAYNIIAVEYDQFSANSAAFYSAKRQYGAGYRCYYTSLGYAETDIQRALNRINLVAPKFVLTVEPSKQTPPDYLNAVSLPMAKLLATDPKFVLTSTIENSVLVYRRPAVIEAAAPSERPAQFVENIDEHAPSCR